LLSTDVDDTFRIKTGIQTTVGEKPIQAVAGFASEGSETAFNELGYTAHFTAGPDV
jgi:hypothetical protein